MDAPLWLLATALSATVAVIFGFSAAVGPPLERWKDLQGLERVMGRRPKVRVPMRRQLRTVAVICVVTVPMVLAMALAERLGPLLLVVALLLFVAMIVAVIVLSVRDVRRAKRAGEGEGTRPSAAELESHRALPPLPRGPRWVLRCVFPALMLAKPRVLGLVVVPPVMAGLAVAGQVSVVIALAATVASIALPALAWRTLDEDERPAHGPCGEREPSR